MSNSLKKLKEGSENRSVLIIDDDPELAASLSRILKVFFKEYVIANDGEEAFALFTARADKNPFSLVITDLELPKMGGLRLIRQIRSIAPKQPIMILSAHDEAQYMAEAIRLDVQNYLLKPLSMPKLFESLEKVFSIEPHLLHADVTELDKVTGWKTFNALADRIQTLEGKSITLMRMHLNHLSNITTLVGEMYANEYLQELALVLQSLILDLSGEFYRIGADELCLILEGDQVKEALTLANTMVSVVRYFHTSDQGIILNSTLSVGIAYGKETVFLHSALALEKVNNRQVGGVCHHTFTQESNEIVMHKSREILRMIFNALNDENIVPFFQTINDVNSQKPLIMDSVIRIRKDGKLFGPETFLSLAKEMGQMSMITRSMIRNTLKISQTFLPKQFVSISLSSYDLSDEGLLPYIRFWLERYQILPEKIIFQLTEGIEMLKSKQVSTSIKELQSNGHKIILNNFGSGQCNISNLLLLQPDYIRLHPDFIQKIETQSSYLTIIEKMVEIIHLVGAKAIAAQVSTPTQISLIRQIKIDYMEFINVDSLFEVKCD